MKKIRASRYHDISCGHRIVGHEGKCANLHGHNYRIHFHCEADNLDEVGRVVDFGVIKLYLCGWLENNWDHKFIMWDHSARKKAHAMRKSVESAKAKGFSSATKIPSANDWREAARFAARIDNMPVQLSMLDALV